MKRVLPLALLPFLAQTNFAAAADSHAGDSNSTANWSPAAAAKYLDGRVTWWKRGRFRSAITRRLAFHAIRFCPTLFRA